MNENDVTEIRLFDDRAYLLADVAEMYYLEGKDQAQIAKVIGVTRSMVSRMISEARSRKIVEIRIARPVQTEYELEQALIKRFALKEAIVVSTRSTDQERLIHDIGRAAAQVVIRFLAPETIVGLAWGTSISATIDAIETQENVTVKVVQLVGAMGARIEEYDGHSLVQQLAEKLGGEAYFLNAPFICQSSEMVNALLSTQGILETVTLGKQTQVALLGIGSAQPQYSSYYLAGYVPREELKRIQIAGAVGDIAGIHFDLEGKFVCEEFYQRLVTIQRENLVQIPARIGVAGGSGKVAPILGALHGGWVNILVTDSITAKKVLDVSQS